MQESPWKRAPRKKRSNSPVVTPLADDLFLFKESPDVQLKSRVALFDKYITIEPFDESQDKCKVQIDFDTIFSVLQSYASGEDEEIFNGIPYGIKLEKHDQSISILCQQPEVVRKWSKLLGRVLNQRSFHQVFKPIKKIGKGNFASVYLVVKNEDKQQFAVKAFSKEVQYADDRGKESLENEIKIMRFLNHPNLMKIEGVFETDNSIYFIVEYLRGGLLYDKIKKRHQFTTEQTLEIMLTILKGVEHMHDKKIMHRDLKPENIIFREEDSYECVIADFGLATFSDIGQYIYTRCGTPGYVAPQISNLKEADSHYDPICDMFSVGVIFHLILLGTSPFPGKECDQVLLQNRECNIDFDHDCYKRLHPNCTHFVIIGLDLLMRMLEKDPTKRISAKEALQHPFFTESSIAICEELQMTKYQECDSPLMMTRNNQRKRNLKLRDDSCLKFKMKESIPMCKEDYEENIDRINSPLKKKIVRVRNDRHSKTVVPSNFKH